MIYLILSILCSSAIFIIFKSFDKYKVTTFTAIVINYFIAASTGFITLGESIDIGQIIYKPWFVNSIILGFVFISLFNVMAITAQKLGASVASIANKMALIIPVGFAILYYNDVVNVLKISGIILALIGVFLSTLKPKEANRKLNYKLIFIPILLFVGSGFIDTFLKYNQEYYLNESHLDAKLFSACTFLTAFTIGITTILIDKSKRSFDKATIIGGIVLGVINYGSIYFLIQIFNHSNLESSVVFPINNMGVVLLTAAASFVLYKERFSTANKAGIIISLVALALILFSR